MTTKSQTPIRFGEWVYLTTAIDQYPIGTYGKLEFFAKLEQAKIKISQGKTLLVHPDKLDKLSAEEIGFKERDEYLLIEPIGDYLPGTKVHFVTGLGGDHSTCFTDEGREVFCVYPQMLTRIVAAEENPVVWSIQQQLKNTIFRKESQ